jgi:hypothetical protein
MFPTAGANTVASQQNTSSLCRIPITADERQHGSVITSCFCYSQPALGKILWDNTVLAEKVVIMNGYCVLENVRESNKVRSIFS